MEQYKTEKEFLEDLNLKDLQMLEPPNGQKGLVTLSSILYEYKTHLIEQAKKEKQSTEDCLNQWDGLPLGKDETEWYPRKAVLMAMEEYAQQFIPVAPAEKWIEIKSYKDLPKKYSDVIVFGRFTKDCPKRVYEATFNPKKGKFYSDGILSKDVNHWMPLPAAPGQSDSNP